ncbi:Ku protein (plasmid) [Paracoccus liaowanqingii]|uniref:Non-homologous end joining protein Ku n=1 Tax=Paracoccus liaowanqingii TaxID=2560053 RepID=A0A4Y5STT6_9RHOB|nr:Ku protein [Paracoccus liaowanqingii]QDA36910.1 Ku protein [Paracoccus liaowanqingii]
MAPRVTWKGAVRLGELTVPVALYAAATTSERISFHIINRDTGNRVHREYIDEETEEPVDKDDQIKGYEISKDRYVILEPDEIAAAVPDSDKMLTIEAFIPCSSIETVYFDKPYFIAPADEAFADAFAVLREGMRKQKVAALARAVLFRRVRTVMLRVQGLGLVAHTLNFDYEVRSADEAFEDLPDVKVEGELLDLAKHIIGTKLGTFDPRNFDDRYDQAVAELVKAKIAGRKIKAPKPPKETKVVSLLDALRKSAEASGSDAQVTTKKGTGSRKGSSGKSASSGSGKKAAEPSRPRKKAG